MKIPFVGGSYEMEAKSFSVQRALNIYPLASDVGADKSISALRPCAGLSLFATVGGGSIRNGISSTSGRMFVVSGQDFYEVFADGTSTDHGSLNTQVGRVSIAENKFEIIVVDGQDGWIFTKATDTWTQITSVNFPTCSTVTYQDGYFIVVEEGTQNFYISGINDGLSWGALDFTSVESSPDDLLSVISDNGNLWLLGNRSVEVYQNTGNATFPFERIAGAIIQTGCAGKYTVQKFDNTIVWLGVDEQGQGVVWRANGYQVQRISTQAIEQLISDSDDFTDSFAFVYHERGHVFYCLQIRNRETTLCYDGSTGQWHERAYLDTATNSLVLHRASCFMFFNQKGLVGDRETGDIYEMSLDYNDDAGNPQVRERTAMHIQDEKRNITMDSFELDIEVGQGLTTGQGSDPQIMLQVSKDGGETWSDERWKSIGKKGKYNKRVIWRRLGIGRDIVFRVRVTDPVFFQINEAYLNGD